MKEIFFKIAERGSTISLATGSVVGLEVINSFNQVNEIVKMGGQSVIVILTIIYLFQKIRRKK